MQVLKSNSKMLVFQSSCNLQSSTSSQPQYINTKLVNTSSIGTQNSFIPPVYVLTIDYSLYCASWIFVFFTTGQLWLVNFSVKPLPCKYSKNIIYAYLSLNIKSLKGNNFYIGKIIDQLWGTTINICILSMQSVLINLK